MPDSWSIGVRLIFLPGGQELLAFALLSAEVAPVAVRVLDMERFPWQPWREREYQLPIDVVARLHANLARQYPELLPAKPFNGFDGIDVRLAITRVGVTPADAQMFRFRMWTPEFHTNPAVEVVWDLLEPWRAERSCGS